MLAGAAHTPLLASAVLFVVGCVSTVLNRHGLAEPLLIRPAAVAAKLPTAPVPQLHEPYVHELRSSKYYRGLCRPEDGCRVETRNGSALAAQPACTPELLKGWNGAGSWAVDEAGHYSWEPSHCRLRRLAAAEARQCLNRKKLVFIGDSITRYMYSTLVHFLSREVWPERYGGQQGGRSVVIGREFVSGKTSPDIWPRMYNYTSRLFSSARHARAWESCDCERNVKEERVFHLDSFAVHGDLESPAGSDSNSRSGNSNGGSSNGNSGSSSGNSSSSSGSSGSKGSGFLSASFKFIGPRFLNDSVAALRAAVQDFGVSGHDGGWVQFHVGLWNRRGLDRPVPLKPILQEAVSAMQQLLPPAGPKPLLLWRSTTTTSTPKVDEMYGRASAAYMAEAAEVPPWHLWDVRALTQQAQQQGMQLRWDDKHYLAIAYEEMCNLLLNMLCDTELQFQGGVPEAAA